MENFFDVKINAEHLYLLGKKISHLTKLRKVIAQKMMHASREESGGLLTQSKEIVLHRAALRLEKNRLLKSLGERERHAVEVAVRCRHIENDRKLAEKRRREKQAKKLKQPAERFNHKIAWFKNALGERYGQIVPKEYRVIFDEGEYCRSHCFENFYAKQWLNRVYRRLKNTPHLVAYRIWNKSLHFLHLQALCHFESYREEFSTMFVKRGNPECPKFEEFGLNG